MTAVTRTLDLDELTLKANSHPDPDAGMCVICAARDRGRLPAMLVGLAPGGHHRLLLRRRSRSPVGDVNRPARSLPGVPWQRHPSESDDRVASPGDGDLTMDLVGVILEQPVVYERDIYVQYDAERGWSSDGEVETTRVTPFTGSVTVVLHEESISEPQFDWIVALLERWATDATPLRFVAAPGRLSALYAPDGEFTALPAT